MEKFQFTEGQRVREKATGKVGIVIRLGTISADNRFYWVEFADGQMTQIAEKDLWPA